MRLIPVPLLVSAALAVAAFATAPVAVPAAAPLTGEALEHKVQEITEQFRCPTCQAISVRDSEAGFSRQIREHVREMLQAGKSEEEIKAYFVSRYGEWILRAPKKQGVGLVLWILPFAGILFAGALIVWRLRRNERTARKDAPAAAPPLNEAERARIERDLRRFERGF